MISLYVNALLCTLQHIVMKLIYVYLLLVIYVYLLLVYFIVVYVLSMYS